MASSLAIKSLTSNQDGATAAVVLDGAPAAGNVRWWASEKPDVATAREVTAALVAGVYTVTFPHSGGWYLWPVEQAGFGQMGAGWINYSDLPVVDELGEAVRDILIANKLLLDAQLRKWYPDAQVQQVVYGFGGMVNRFPAIVVMNPRYTWEWYACPFVRQYVGHFDIGFCILHGDEQSELENAASFAAAGGAILEQTHYETITLPSGVVVNACSPIQGDMQEIEVEEGVFAATGTIQWSGDWLFQTVSGAKPENGTTPTW